MFSAGGRGWPNKKARRLALPNEPPANCRSCNKTCEPSTVTQRVHLAVVFASRASSQKRIIAAFQRSFTTSSTPVSSLSEELDRSLGEWPWARVSHSPSSSKPSKPGHVTLLPFHLYNLFLRKRSRVAREPALRQLSPGSNSAHLFVARRRTSRGEANATAIRPSTL